MRQCVRSERPSMYSPYWFTFVVSPPQSGGRCATVGAGEADATRGSLQTIQVSECASKREKKKKRRKGRALCEEATRTQ